MDQRKRIRLISNSFYNAGLERAQRRDLTGAVRYLQTCLNLYKYHIDARNLLGLIYFELGEVSEALVQWVISMNIQEKKNLADSYLEQLQRRPERLEKLSQNIRRYNQALVQAQTEGDDLAVLQLTRVVEENPNFVKAQLLLALLYIAHEDYTKAGKALYKVLKVDKNNPRASWYMSIVKDKTGKAEVERKKLKNAFSHRQMQDDDVIIPPSYKENTGWQSVLNIGAGLLLGTAAIYFLVMPAQTKALNHTHAQELLQYNEQLNQKNEEINSLNDRLEVYLTEKEAAEQELDSMLNNNDSMLHQYSILVKMQRAYQTGNLEEVVSYYSDFNPELFSDETVRSIANGLQQEIATNGYQTLQDQGYTMWSAGRFAEALKYYEICLKIRPENPNVLYNMAMIYKAQGETEQAVETFTELITKYGDSEQAVPARSQLSELVPQNQQAAIPGRSILDLGQTSETEDENGQE